MRYGGIEPHKGGKRSLKHLIVELERRELPGRFKKRWEDNIETERRCG
jgi:hypothetical protein